MRRFFRSAILIISAFLFFSCQSYSEDPLATDKASVYKCPANGCANSTPDPNDLSIHSGAAQFLGSKVDSGVMIGGDCFASTFPDNRIDYTITKGAVNIPVFSAALGSNDGVIRCVKGRFNFVLDLAALRAGGVPAVYNVRMTLVGRQNNSDYNGGNNITAVTLTVN